MKLPENELGVHSILECPNSSRSCKLRLLKIHITPEVNAVEYFILLLGVTTKEALDLSVGRP